MDGAPRGTRPPAGRRHPAAGGRTPDRPCRRRTTRPRLLFEIGLEELPHHEVTRAPTAVRRRRSARSWPRPDSAHGEITVQATPRRIVVHRRRRRAAGAGRRAHRPRSPAGRRVRRRRRTHQGGRRVRPRSGRRRGRRCRRSWSSTVSNMSGSAAPKPAGRPSRCCRASWHGGRANCGPRRTCAGATPACPMPGRSAGCSRCSARRRSRWWSRR